jgi:peptidoglycan-associated lipoprotein
VGTLSVPPLVFGRGTAKLTEQSQLTLDELIEQLKSWPQYYLLIRGNASTRGNVDANKKLALERAVAALEYLKTRGVDANRMRAVAGDLTGETSVQFVFGQTPF